MRAKHTHYLVMPDGHCPADVPVLLLSLNSSGREVLAGDQCRDCRDALAFILGASDWDDFAAPGTLAELLLSSRPIVVTSAIGGYVFEEV